MSKVALSREKTHWQVLRLIKPISFRLIFHRFWSAFLKTVIHIYVFLLSYRFHSESLEEKLESLEAEDLMSHLSRPETYLEEEKRSNK